MGKLDGKVALLTGSSPNIVGGIAEGLADEGAKIVSVDIFAGFANGCAEAINERGGEAIGLVCDVTNEEQVQATVEQARQAFGGIDILVNGAVIFNWAGVVDMPVEQWRHQLDVILTGNFLVTKHVSRLMIEQQRKGSIINIISTAGHQGEPWNVAYSTGKGGLLNFTRSVAMELSQHGIRVNSLTPTATDPSEGRERAGRWGVEWPRPRPYTNPRQGPGGNARAGSPLRTLPSPSHYGKAAAFLASDEAEMITGFDMRVDAGALAKYWIWDPSSDSGP